MTGVIAPAQNAEGKFERARMNSFSTSIVVDVLWV